MRKQFYIYLTENQLTICYRLVKTILLNLWAFVFFLYFKRFFATNFKFSGNKYITLSLVNPAFPEMNSIFSISSR